MAFEDAELLSRCLLNGHPLSAWEAERRRRVGLVVAATRASGKTRKVGRASWAAFTLKTLAMWAYFHLPLGLEQRVKAIYAYNADDVDLGASAHAAETKA
jgi:hypothetical protein